MIIPDGQIWTLHHIGTAYYWTRWLDAPLRDDRVTVMGLPCRVVVVVQADFDDENTRVNADPDTGDVTTGVIAP